MEESCIICVPASFLSGNSYQSREVRSWESVFKVCNHSIWSGLLLEIQQIQQLLPSPSVLGAGEELFAILGNRVPFPTLLLKKLCEGIWYRWCNTLFQLPLCLITHLARARVADQRQRNPWSAYPFCSAHRQLWDSSGHFHFPSSRGHNFYSGKIQCKKNNGKFEKNLCHCVL